MPPPVTVDPVLKKQEQEALNKVVVHRFTADPSTVKTFGMTTISWDVTVPDSSFDINVKLNQQIVSPNGSKTFSLPQATIFNLSAATEHASRLLRRLTVNVDASECRTKQVVSSDDLVNVLTGEFNKQFKESSEVKLRGSTGVTVGERTISIGVPLEIEVPNWSNAEMTIGIQLDVPAGPQAAVSAKHVSVDVRWTFLEHLASLFCTGFVQGGMEQLARVFMSHIVDTELVPRITQAFKEKADAFVSSLSDEDPQHRTYIAKLMVLSRDGFTVTACPET